MRSESTSKSLRSIFNLRETHEENKAGAGFRGEVVAQNAEFEFRFAKAQNFIAEGDLLGACGVLEGLLETNCALEQANKTRAILIRCYVSLSRHQDAVSCANVLRDSLKMKPVPLLTSRILAQIILVTFRTPVFNILLQVSRLVLSYWLPRSKSAQWEQIQAVHFARFWEDISVCPGYGVVQLLEAKTDYEIRSSIAWYGYSLGYAGISSGMRLLRASIYDAHKQKDMRFLQETYPIMAINYMDGFGDTERAQHYHNLVIRRYPGVSPFFKLLSLTNQLHVSLAKGDFANLKIGIEQCFKYGFALTQSRHLLQTYGCQAILMALEGRRDEARATISKAELQAQLNHNNLDTLIFNKLACIAEYFLEDIVPAKSHLASAFIFCKTLGNPKNVRSELHNIANLLSTSRMRNFAKMSSTELLRSSSSYLISEAVKERQKSDAVSLSLVTDKLSKILASPFSLNEDAPIEELQLTSKMEEALGGRAISARNIDELRERVSSCVGTHFIQVSEEQQSVRMICQDGSIFIGKTVPRTNDFQPPIAVGIFLKDLDLLTEPLLTCAFAIILSQYSFVESLKISKLETRKHERDKAIAKTTQMLAHDVRKPFSMFKMIIDAVDGEDDPIEAKQLLKESLPEVQQAMASVNGMISDILEIGSNSEPVVEPTNPETLIEATLNEIFRVYPESKVNVAYDLNHTHKVSIDTLKIGRVFSNIVGNAVQAMNRKGSLWFKTEEFEESGKPFVKFCLGNEGSFIPPENLPKLFDAFFTSGKKGGTGLGLAIAQKIVTAHGGKIWCESDAQRGVEFFFTVPCANELCDARPMPLPASSAVITSTFERLRRASIGSERVDADLLEVTLEKEIIKLAQAARTPLKILVVDDEGVYRNSLAALINRSTDLKANISLSFAKNSHEALKGAVASPALIIQDVDLGVNSLNGYEVLKTLRAQGYGGVVCIHSNRTSPDGYKAAVEAGADAVLPKPMSRTHFLKLVLQAAERSTSRVAPASAKTVVPEFALLDDSRLTLRAWQRKIGNDAIVHVFTSPNEFRAHVQADEGFLARLEFVVTDFYFAEGVLDTGFTFAESLKPVFVKPILLCSDGHFNTEMFKEHVDAVISKAPIPWSELSSKVTLLSRIPSKVSAGI